MRNIRRIICTVAVFHFAGGALRCEAAPRFELIEPLDGLGGSYGAAMSSNGRFVVGSMGEGSAFDQMQFRWSRRGGAREVRYHTAEGEVSSFILSGISDDPRIMKGMVNSNVPGRLANGQLEVLGLAPNDSSGIGYPLGFSSDGSTIVGGGDFADFAWRAGTGWIDLGTLPGVSYHHGQAYDASTDGRVVVGRSHNAQGKSQAYFWTEETGKLGLSAPAGSPYRLVSSAAVSEDGHTVLGSARAAGLPDRVFLWRSDGTVAFVPDSDEIAANDPLAISGDGKTVLGYGAIVGVSPPQGAYFLYRESKGVILLSDLFEDLDLVPEGFEIDRLIDMSASGKNFLGLALNTATGEQYAFVAHIPGPGAATLVLASLGACAIRRRRHGTGAGRTRG